MYYWLSISNCEGDTAFHSNSTCISSFTLETEMLGVRLETI